MPSQVLQVGMPYCSHHKAPLSEAEIDAKGCRTRNNGECCRHFGYLKQIVRF